MSAASFTKSATISIEGTVIEYFRSISITQSIHTYHDFEVAFEHEQVEAQQTLNSSVKDTYIGKNISLIISGEKPDVPGLTFNGVINEAALALSDSAHMSSIVLRGHGLPYKLDSIPGISAYYDMSVSDIVNKCLSAYTGLKQVGTAVGPAHILPYCVRYQETYWEFLRRLAYDYGAWFYYDGQKLQFTTTPGTAPPLALEFGIELINLRAVSKAVPKFIKQFDYFPLDDKDASASGSANAPFFATLVERNQPGRRQSLTTSDVASFTKNRSSVAVANDSYVEGEAEYPGLSVGTTLRISDPKSGQSLGDYNVVEVWHHMNEDREYHNRFRAISASNKVMPNVPLARPVSETQLGVVVDNKDPRNLGRVQARLLWMDPQEKTPWLRVTAPHYGVNAKNEKSRGFMFVPEINDQVMVAFEYGDPERPIVIGSVPHGKNAAVPNPAVKEHHLSVNSGTTITFSDTQTDHELHLQVDANNLITIVVNSGQGTITLQASKSIVLKAKQEITIDAPKIAITGDSVSIKGNVKTDVAGGMVNIKADSQLNAEGMLTKVVGTTMANLESDVMTVVKGAMVMIN